MNKARQIGALRQALASLDSFGEAGRHGVFTLGAGPVDAALGGGLARGAVHEIYPAQAFDIAAAAGFAAGLCLRAVPDAPLLWIRHRRSEIETGALYAQGFAEMGVAVDRLVMVHVDDFADGLRASLEGLRCAGLGGVIFESWGNSKHLDLTASRRLSLAAQDSGATGLLLRVKAGPEPSAAATRWQVEAAPSSDLLGLPGRPALRARLLRQKSGPSGWCWNLEWNHETLGFAQTQALSGAVAAPYGDRPAGSSGGSGWAEAI
ncbi:ImuA family protein [Pelagibacterium sp.]|uniref:ImuA family protein n=1 Tax=Pelagibacterium sp. TaxID=1967288 RepID=UPI003BAC1D98